MTMLYGEDSAEAVPLSPATEASPCTSNNIFGKVFRKLSLKRKGSRSSLRRKSSQTSASPLDSLNLQGFFSQANANAARVDCNTFFNVQNESLYRGVLRCLLHQVGAVEQQVGLRPGDLIDHARQVFHVDQEDHEYFVRDELQNKLTRVQATVTVVEARDLHLHPDRDKGENSPFCLLTLTMPHGKMTKTSPKDFHKNSKDSPKNPKDSPKASRKDSSKVSVKDSPKTSRTNSPKLLRKESSKLSLKDSPKTSRTNSPKLLRKDSSKLSLKDSPKTSRQNSPKLSRKESSKVSLKDSPKGSPKSSPRSSPRMKRSTSRSQSVDAGDVLRTQPARGVLHPSWNEQFTLDVENPLLEEIHLCVCLHDDPNFHDNNNGGRVHSEKSRALRGFFRNILQSSDNDKSVPGCIGQLVLPIREVPSQGFDGWLNIYPFVGGRWRSVGQCHLQVVLSFKQDSLYGGQFSPEDYHLAALLCYRHALACPKESEAGELSLPLSSRRSLDIFAAVNGISKLSQIIMELTVLLEMAALQREAGGAVTDSVLHKALEEAQITWGSKQVCAQDCLQRMPLSDAEICLYRSTVRQYVDHILSQLPHLPPLFPPSHDAFLLLKQRFGLAQHLLELDLWEATGCPQTQLSDTLLAKLQADIAEWMEKHLQSILSHDQVKDAVIPETEAMVKVLATLTSHCTPLGVVQQFFACLGLNYYRTVTFQTERRVSSVVRRLMVEMDKYHLRYHAFAVNTEASSRLSLRLFFAVRAYYLTLRDNVSDRDVFRLTVRQYQDWFQESLVIWLQTFKTECLHRMEKALEIDKDLVVATSLVKFSNSSVDVLSCFAKITEEWREIDFQDPDCAVMGVTKITDLICDGARMYADKVHSILERNCYYHPSHGHFDVTERLCITLNNIEHVRQYLNELSGRLQWSRGVQQLATRHESSGVGCAALSTLRRLVTSAHHDILLKARVLLREIARRMRQELLGSMRAFLVTRPDKPASTEACVAYLDANLQTLHGQLSASIYPSMISQLWAVVLSVFDEHVTAGKRPEYYQQMTTHLRCLVTFFTSCGLEEDEETNPLLSDLQARLHLNSLASEQLMLEYFHTLATCMGTPVDYLGHLALKMGYMEETRGNVTVYVKVIRGSDLPGLDLSGLSDPYVTVRLQPSRIFPHKAQKTRVIGQTVQPVFNTTFQFPNVARDYLTTRGAVLLLTVFDYDRLKADDFAGEVVVPLSSLTPLGQAQTVDSLPVVMLPLKPPSNQATAPLNVLRDRQSWDASSKTFVNERSKLMKSRLTAFPDIKSRGSIFNFFSALGFGSEANDT